MNENALQIYSFLMRHEIPFIRYCHLPCPTTEALRHMLRHGKQDAVVPETGLLCQNGKTCLYLFSSEQEHTRKADRGELLSPKASQNLLRNLHCTSAVAAPLGLVFSRNAVQCVAVAPALLRANLWCLSPCSEESSVLIQPAAFLDQFLPAVGCPYEDLPELDVPL